MPALPADLTLENARAVGESLSIAVAVDPVLDASPLRQIDSAALAVLLQCQRAAQQAGRSLSVVGAPPKLVALARLYGLDSLLGLAPE